VAQASQNQISQAGSFEVGDLLTAQARRRPEAVAVVDGARSLNYKALNSRTNKLANALTSMGISRGDRIAILSENSVEYLETTYAAAKLGVILAALNWRLARNELTHCISLVQSKAMLVSTRFAGALHDTDWRGKTIFIGDEYEQLLARNNDAEPSVAVEPEDGLLILYTSGTTGLPKGALISHRAELARMQLSRLDLGLVEEDGFIAWAPMFHMVSLEHALHVLGMGGKSSSSMAQIPNG
jgi:acyl-CoA synthetase (AMP-forming)/AMP-acid ligase II